ncbi:hypothetical protein NXZ75_13670 [Lysinibacillus sphaericus]|uniref:hypothetical protein n=1 Tax=Lysinibacillus sphaericus TaxID=1421 RepID=UPI0021630884|nr:hypothetical protein [Lysinibacillus sphaericus]MCS1383250.1 hypothetical protein [Lysinibacillus sphaericus]
MNQQTTVFSVKEHEKFLSDTNSPENLMNFFKVNYIQPIEDEIGKENIVQEIDNKNGIYTVTIGDKELIVNLWTKGVTFHIENKNEKSDGIPEIRVKFEKSIPKVYHAKPKEHEKESLKQHHLELVIEKLLSK